MSYERMSYERMSYERMSEFPALISAERFCKDILRYFCQKPLTYYDINLLTSELIKDSEMR